jgi:hypothetical protein
MAHNPVQVVLNTDQYMKRPETGGGGGAKDFFEGRDSEFVRHKAKLLREVETIRTSMSSSRGARIGYVKVRLQSAALAKSHRPLDAIFKPREFPLVGTGALGELFFEVTPGALDRAAAAITGAEDRVTKRNKRNKLAPSDARSEVGAIEAIALPSLNDKRAFTVEQAQRYFLERPTARYIAIELFIDETMLAADDGDRREARGAVAAFRKELQGVAEGLNVWSSEKEWKYLHVTSVHFPQAVFKHGDIESVLQRLTTFLDRSPVVRRYSLGAAVRHAATRPRVVRSSASTPATLRQPRAGVDYPVVGIVDAGVSRFEPLAAWSAGSLNYMREPDSHRDHGTFIAGLLVDGASFNPGQPIEQEPCKYFDFDLFTEDDNKFDDNFENGFIDMMRQLGTQLGSSKPAGLRVINLSLNPDLLTDQEGYSPEAAILDELADKYDVIFVVSAGNLQGAQVRNRWPENATPALQQIATYRPLGADRIYVPGETARNVTVGALEPIDAEGRTRPARYSRRGPATSAGTKPDFGHVGGCEAGNIPLKSIDPVGRPATGQGTSYAAPLIAKTLAILDHRIAGKKPRELLLALMYHFAGIPSLLNDKLLKDVCKDFAGFGIPGAVEQMLTTDDSSITLVFTDTLPPGLELSFDFAWPAALVQDGRTRGKVALTIAYSPPLDRQHQAEFARVNLDAYLRQEQVDDDGVSTYHGRLKADHSGTLEKNLIAHGAKWWPVKHYSKTFSKLEGTSNWRLVVDSLTRAGAAYPAEGVKFAIVLTIADPEGEAPVFATARSSLVSKGVNLRDVRTTTRLRAR